MPSQSPFNVATVCHLADFTEEEVAKLNDLHGHPFTKEYFKQLYDLVGGHPYLTRVAMYLVAGKELSSKELLTSGSFRKTEWIEW